MTNEQILEEQVEALEKLNQLKSAVIEELEAKIQKLEGQTIHIGSGSGFAPSQWNIPTPLWQCTDGNPHQYPQPWGGTIPPCCTKCGQMASSNNSWPISIQNGGLTFTSAKGNIPIHTTGYMQPVDPQDVTFYSIDNAAKKQSV